MKINKCKEEHDKDCDGKIEVFTLLLNDCVHVELTCSKCEKRYVYDIYQMEEV